MLKHEFEELIGCEVDDEEFRDAELVYTRAGRINKVSFAQCHLPYAPDPQTRALVEQVERSRRRIEELEKRCKELESKITEVAHELLQEWNNHQLRHSHDQAVKLIGHMAAMKYMVAKKMPLTADDYELIERCVWNIAE